jgi:regulator of protease activity HflC (stomatin/prohibitin superfamily)
LKTKIKKKIWPNGRKEEGMKEFILGIYIGLGIIGLIAVVLGVIALVYFFARHNIIWTIVREGAAKGILKFGKLSRIVMAYQGYGLTPEWKVEPGESKKSGLRLVGIPFVHSVYKYEFRWTSFEQTEEGGKLVQKAIAHKGEILDYILVQDDVYYTFIREAETSDMVPVDVDLLLTIRIINPYLALFRVQNWLEATQNQLKPVLRGYIANKKFSELITRKEGAKRELEELLIKAVEATDADTDETLGNYLERHYGVRIKKVGLVRIDPAGERGKIYQEAASQKWEADRERERIQTIADADVDRMDRVYGKVLSYGDDGLLIKAFESIEKVGSGPSNLVIFPFGSIKDILKGWLGKGRKEE